MAKYITKYRGLNIMDKGARDELKKQPTTTKIEENKLYLLDKSGNKLDAGVDLPVVPEVDLSDYAKRSEIPTVPTKTSELTNDSNFVNETTFRVISDKVNALGSFTVYDETTGEETTLALDQNVTE